MGHCQKQVTKHEKEEKEEGKGKKRLGQTHYLGKVDLEKKNRSPKEKERYFAH